MRAWLGWRGSSGGDTASSNGNGNGNAVSDGRGQSARGQDARGGRGGNPQSAPPNSSYNDRGRLTRSSQSSEYGGIGGGGGGGVIRAIMEGHRSHAAAAADAEMERRVAVSARNLGDGVSRIVLAARMGGPGRGGDPGEWKGRLLKLLGGADEDSDMASSSGGFGLDAPMGGGPMGGNGANAVTPLDDEDPSDIDILLENSSCERFVLRCVENELPPNLIHCLRLLRVLELQHDHSVAALQRQREVEGDEYRGVLPKPGPVSTRAAGRVSRLLRLLCRDGSVGEQLRPHLFGLLALSGASYPASGVHIAGAASDVIGAFSSNCLSASLVWFLHDRKMIVHMTDDIKELCAMTAVAASAGASGRCLYGPEAEAAGLWAVALRTVVGLVSDACRRGCAELLRDYDGAGGYHVLAYAIANSREEGNVRKLLELVTVLACCRTEPRAGTRGARRDDDDGENREDDLNETLDEEEDEDTIRLAGLAEDKLAANTDAIEIVDELVMRSIGLFGAYKATHGGRRPGFRDPVDLAEAARFAVRYAWELLLRRRRMNDGGSGGDSVDLRMDGSESGKGTSDSSVDLTSELLVTTLQLYSDHARNFDLVEGEYHVLSHYMLALPAFSDVSVKVMALKTLEYVCTGLAGASCVAPLRAATEVFSSMCGFLLEVAREAGEEDVDRLAALEVAGIDLGMLRDTLVKLLEFDENVGHVMLDCGLLGSKVDGVLDIIARGRGDANDKRGNEGERALGMMSVRPTPSESTRMDETYASFCRIIRLVARQPGARSVVEGGRGPVSTSDDRGDEDGLTSLLASGILCLGDTSSRAALDVFESMMARNGRGGTNDDGGVDDGDRLGEDMGRLLAMANALAPAEPSRVDPLFILRQSSVFDMIRSILPSSRLAQDAFRTRGGFECLARTLFRLEGAAAFPGAGDTHDHNSDGGRSPGVAAAVMRLLESAFALVSAATDPAARGLKRPSGDSADASPLPPLDADLPEDMYGDRGPDGATASPSAANLLYLRNYGFYIELAEAVAGTGALQDVGDARRAMNLALELVHPRLALGTDGRRGTGAAAVAVAGADARVPGGGDSGAAGGGAPVRNADAARLVLGLTTRLPDTDAHRSLAKGAFDELLRLCANDMAGSSLARLASSGLCASLTSQDEFAGMLEDRGHFLYSRFVLLLRRIAAFGMTHDDFVSLLRCVAGPILLADQDNDDEEGDDSNTAANPGKRIRLQVITSSVQNRNQRMPKGAPSSRSEAWQSRETGHCNRLETLSVIAERGDRVARCEVGGDSLNSVAMYMQKVPLEDRLYRLAEQGRLRFLEVESVDAGAAAAAAGIAGSKEKGGDATAGAVWSPLVGSGFTYCAWVRQHHPVKDGSQCSLFVFDVSSPPAERSDGAGTDGRGAGSGSSFPYGSSGHEFFSFWYDIPNQRFCVLSSSNSRGEPTCFPVSPLPAGVWHHVQLTYQAPKRSMLGRKAVIMLYIDGRPVESDARVEAFNLPPTARVHVGVPNPVLASSGIVRGSLPPWDLGPALLVSQVLGLRDATAMYAAGPEFPGLFWGDRPQRLSLAAAATAAFVMLAENGEKGSVASALRRRKVPSMEAVGHVMRERGGVFGSGGPGGGANVGGAGGGPGAVGGVGGSSAGGPESDSLGAVGLLCKIPPESIIFGFRASSSSPLGRGEGRDPLLAPSGSGLVPLSRRSYARRLINVSRVGSSSASSCSTDGVVYGRSSIISPSCFADNVQWIGGPNILMPIVDAARSSSSLALSLRMIRESVRRHPPNLETLQAGGGYRMLALLLRQKRIMDVNVLDQCFAFAVHGFVPGFQERGDQKGGGFGPPSSSGGKGGGQGAKGIGDSHHGPLSKAATHRWVFADLDAMKYLLLNHQVWDLNGAGPELPLRLLTYFNGLVVAHSTHAAFNSRRLHLLGIIRWTLHLMLEATELYAAGASAARDAANPHAHDPLDRLPRSEPERAKRAAAREALRNGWHSRPPPVSRVASGCDPGNDVLLGCKTLLRRVLTFMLTPGDLEAIAGAAIYTVSITGGSSQGDGADATGDAQAPPEDGEPAGTQQQREERLAPGAVARVYLLRLLEELVVDGVNEIVTDDVAKGGGGGGHDGDGGAGQSEPAVEPHLGGSGPGAGGSYLGRPRSMQNRGGDPSGASSSGGMDAPQSSSSSSAAAAAHNHPKHQEAQIFLSAFAGILTPVWFACILEGCREEASASAVLRLMILMIQNSRKFARSFEEAGGFAPLVLSIPKFSTCPGIILSMLSHLLHAPILHLPCLASLDPKQLCDVFDAEGDAVELVSDARESALQRSSGGAAGGTGAGTGHGDPSCGIFALLAECLGRNIQLASFDNDAGRRARETNEAVLRLLGHRHAFSPSFQAFCRTPDFLEPLAQALCLVHDERLSRMPEPAFGEAAMAGRDATEDQMTSSRRHGSSGLDVDSHSRRHRRSDSGDSLGNDFVAWPSEGNGDGGGGDGGGGIEGGGRASFSRRGSLGGANTAVTPTERFVGRPDDDEGGTGIGMVQLLHLVLSHAVLRGPLAAPLVSALFRSFPIHASPDQVEAFHLVLIEHCGAVVEDVLQRGEPVAIANCIGVSSVLLDRLMAGFFTSEPVLEAVNIVMLTLNSLTAGGTYASRTLANVDQNLLVADTAHIARLTCLMAIQRSRPMGAYDEGDDELKLAVLTKIGECMRQLLLVPSNLLGGQGTMRGRGSGAGYPAPSPGSRFHPLWRSASLSRCCPPSVSCAYPDLRDVDEPDRAFVVTLMADVHGMLLDGRRDIRERAVVVVVSLLQRRRGIMSELLITDVPRGDGRMETVDLMNRGGFGALLVAHEATTIAENVGGSGGAGSDARGGGRRGRRGGPGGGGGSQSGGGRYASFFSWLERNQEQVAAVFHGIHVQASRAAAAFAAASPGGAVGMASTPEEAIENEQKVMLLKLTSQDSSDRTILGGLERAELAQRSHDATAESHALWKRQGFDDLSSGAMQWKFLLRQLKGSCGIWEGSPNFDGASLFAKATLVSSLLGKKGSSSNGDEGDGNDQRPDGSALVVADPGASSSTNDAVKRWKLDLTEGYERQRRRLLPNYEFHGLYNIDESADDVRYVDETGLMAIEEDAGSVPSSHEVEEEADMGEDAHAAGNGDNRRRSAGVVADMEVTADLLKKMNLEKVVDDDEDDEIMEDEDNDAYALSSDAQDDTSVIGVHAVGPGEEHSLAPPSGVDSKGDRRGSANDSDPKKGPADKKDGGTGERRDETAEDSGGKGNIAASSYDLITGLLKAGDWPEKSYNVSRCTGLEVRQALLLWCRNALYVVDGFEQTDGEGLKGKIKRLKKATASFRVNIRQHNEGRRQADERARSRESGGSGGRSSSNNNNNQDSAEEEITYQHRSQRIAFSDLYSVYRRRYQLQQNALEFYDVHRNGTLIAFSTNAEREEVLTKVLSSPLPSSIFSSSVLGGSASINFKKFMNNLRAKITSQWVQGKMTNFEFIMHMNSFAGRSYNDLTQYPVFPWVLADYESEEIDLNDPKSYRDFSRPMGAQDASRASQFRDRYEALEQSYDMGDGPPPFHYGTHYSCAAYVLYYLMRLEPFSRLALSLQGGKFDVADRLFHNVGASWKSASSENLQDVRELIPEFFYLPDFLVNSNMFDFGTTQMGKTVHDLTLPPWAKGDPKRFIRIHRQALESDHVSRNLHRWLDLIFGYKQRGQEAVASLNTFVHVTYEGQVDLESIEDPVERESIIAQIQNFGQTPSRLERKPFPQRVVVSAFGVRGVDFGSLPSLATLTPPFCVVGAPQRVYLRVSAIDTCKVGTAGQVDSSVGDLCLVKGQLVGVGRTCALILPSRKYYRFGGPNNGVSVHVAVASARYREVNRVLSIHDGMHRGPISVVRPSLNGLWLVTGGMDSTVRVWKYTGQSMQLQATLCGHDNGRITCIDVSTTFGTIVTGGTDGKILLWDLRTLTFLRQLCHAPSAPRSPREGTTRCHAVKSVSANHRNGNIVTLLHSTLCVFDINANLVARQSEDDEFKGDDVPSCAIATDCPEWMELGIVAVSGHVNGDVRLWSIDYESKVLIPRHILPERVHSCPITALRASGERQDTLLIGDASGKMSSCSTLKLDQLNANELSSLVAEAQSGSSVGGVGTERTKTSGIRPREEVWM